MRAGRFLVGASLALAIAGCQPRTEIVLGVITDLKAPDALDEVDLEVRRPDEPPTVDPLIQYQWNVPGLPDQPFILPGSFGLYSSDGSEPRVKIILTGRRNGQAKVVRTSVVSLISEETLFLRQALVAGCVDDTDCSDANNQTCVEGACVDDRIDAHVLPKFSPDLITRVDCGSGTTFVNTGTGQPIPPIGSCAGGEYCQEGTCYVSTTTQSATWHGQAPITTHDLTAAFAAPASSGGNAFFVVGKQGTVLSIGAPAFAPAADLGWQIEPTGVTTDLYGLWGPSAGFLYAVGANGTILVRDSSGWHPDPTAPSNPTATLDSVWGSGAGDIWAVGGDGGKAVALHFSDGWTAVPTPPAGDLRGVSGTSVNDVWMVGKGGAILHWDGSAFSPGPSSTEDFNAVWAGPGGLVLAAAASGKLYSVTQAALTPIDLGDNANPLTAIFGFAPDDLYVVGNGGAIFHGGPTTFTREYSDVPSNLAGVAGLSPSDVFAVGADGAIFHTGAALPSVTDGGAPDLGPAACAQTMVSTLSTNAAPDAGTPTPQAPAAVAYDGSSLWVIDASDGTLYQVSPADGTSTQIYTQDIPYPQATQMVAAPDPAGGTDLWLTESGMNQIVRLTPYMGGMLGITIGTTTAGFKDGVSDGASFNQPEGIAVDAAGNAYVADTNNYAIRKIDAMLNVTSLAGNGTSGSADGTGDSPTAGFGTARFLAPVGIAFEATTGQLYVGDAGTLRQVGPTDGTTTTVTASGQVPQVFIQVAADGRGDLFASASGGLSRLQLATQAFTPLVTGAGPGDPDGNGCMASLSAAIQIVADPQQNRVWATQAGSTGRIRVVTFP